jgi:serine/threonine-protein kinase
MAGNSADKVQVPTATVADAGGLALPAAVADRAVESPTVLSTNRPVRTGQTPMPAGDITQQVVGEALSHYRLDYHIGTGGMGTVFHATDLRLDRPAALKILPPDQAVDPDLVERFRQEARAAARLHHENIAQVYDIGEDRGVQFIAFEFVEGVTVRDLIQQHGALAPADVVRYAIQMARALVHSAARGVVHRDIKPSNIVVTPSGRAKLVDMGLARNFERRKDGGLTQDGVTLGTFDYIAPEQARDPRSTDVRSDIYALGCTLFHALTGQPPYPEGTVLQKLLKHHGDEPPDPRDLAAGIPARLAHIVRRMMAKDPGRRYQTPDVLVRDLVEVAGLMDLRPVSPEGWIWTQSQGRPHGIGTTLMVWGTAAAALLLTVGLRYGPRWWRGPAPAPTATPTSSAIARTVPSSPPAEPAESTADTEVTASDRARKAGETPAEPAQPAARRPAPAPVDVAPRAVAVSRDDDLRAAIETAPDGAVIELVGDGTWAYRPQASHRVDDIAGIHIDAKRMTIRAAVGTRPRIRLDYDRTAAQVSEWVLFALEGSDVTFDGLRFEIDPAAAREPMAMFWGDAATLRFERCSFLELRRHGGEDSIRAESVAPVWVAQLGGAIGADGRARPSTFGARHCFLSGGYGALQCVGPADLTLEECTLLPYRSAVILNSAGYPPALASNLRLTNVTLFGSGEPIFDLQFAHARVQARESVLSHEYPIRGVLARLDSDSQLDWSGGRNWFHGVRWMLARRGDGDTTPVATSLQDWRTAAGIREEASSEEAEASPWQLGLSEAALLNPQDLHVADAFRIRPTSRAYRLGEGNAPIGARTVLPWGPLYPEGMLALTPLASRRDPATRPSSRTDGPPAMRRRDEAGAPADANPGGAPAKPTTAGTAKPNPPMPDMPTVRMPNMEQILNGQSSETATPTATAAASNPSAEPAANATLLVVEPRNSAAFQSLAAACERASDGSVIEIRFNGTLEEPPLVILDRHLTIRAGSGFQPTITRAGPLGGPGSDEPRLFDVRRGSLTLRGLDLRLTAASAVPAPAAIIRSEAADITIDSCVLTVQAGDANEAYLIRAASDDAPPPMTLGTTRSMPGSMRIEMRDSLCLGGGGLLVPAGRRVRVEVENVAIETPRQFLVLTSSAHRPAADARIEMSIRRSTFKTHGGLLLAAADAKRPWLPTLDVSAGDCIFAANDAAAWITIRGTTPTDELAQLLNWRGKSNTYDAAIETLLRLESIDLDDSPQVFGWPEWSSSNEREEIRPNRHSVGFLSIVPAGQPVWERARNHFRLRSTDPAHGAASDGNDRGANLAEIPPSPQERTEE